MFPLDHRSITLILEACLKYEFGTDATLSTDTQSKDMDTFVSVAYKIKIPTKSHKSECFYLYFRNKRKVNPDQTVEFTSPSSYDLRYKDDFATEHKTHFNTADIKNLYDLQSQCINISRDIINTIKTIIGG